jgi:hypothetical protein
LPQALTLDLGQPHPVKEVRVLQRQDGGHCYITRFALYVGENGQDFAKVADGQWPDDAAMKAVAVVPRRARYVKIEALEATAGRNANVSISEIQVITGSTQ